MKVQLKRVLPLDGATRSEGSELPLLKKVKCFLGAPVGPAGWGRFGVPEFAVVGLDSLQRDGVGALLELLHGHVVLLGDALRTLQGCSSADRKHVRQLKS